jgi:endonuclease III
MKAADWCAFFSRLQAQEPHPRTELQYHNSFELLLAVILSAQATDKSVNKATAQLFAVANTPQAILALGEEGLKTYIQSIGLYHSKAAHILKTCAILLDKHNGEVPRRRQDLEALPGVGRKTANVILNTAFGEAVIAVDTHIFRVANRTGLAPGKNVGEVEQKLMRAIPHQFHQHAHHWLILLGRYTCTARKPRCEICLVNDLCGFPEKNAR